MTARFKQFGCAVRMGEIRGMEKFGHRDREGTRRKQPSRCVTAARMGFNPHRSDPIAPTEQNTGKFSVPVELGEACAVEAGHRS